MVDAIINYNEIVDVKASYIGIAYYAENPTLRNPVDWYRVITAAAIVITAMATALALFVACRALKGGFFSNTMFYENYTGKSCFILLSLLSLPLWKEK